MAETVAALLGIGADVHSRSKVNGAFVTIGNSLFWHRGEDFVRYITGDVIFP